MKYSVERRDVYADDDEDDEGPEILDDDDKPPTNPGPDDVPPSPPGPTLPGIDMSSLQ